MTDTKIVTSSPNSLGRILRIIHYRIIRQLNKLISELMTRFENNSLGMTVPKLTKSNYDTWSIHIKSSARSAGCVRYN
jgi:hypothetical protein